jgi:hypothetical protein
MSLPRLAALALAAAALSSCKPEEKPEGCVWPEEPTPPTSTVTESCGWYLLDVGDHLYINVYVTEPESPCEADWEPGLEVPDPIYSDLSNDDPKWTFDIRAQVPGSELDVSIVCEDGTEIEVRVDVG